MDTDGAGNQFEDVGNLRLTFIPADRRKPGSYQPEADAIRIQAYKKKSESNAVLQGAEYHLRSTADLEELINALRRVYEAAQRM